jgi:hypothetical protein
MRKFGMGLMALVLVCTALLGAGCMESDADVAAHNLSVAAEQFEVPRRITFINGITDNYLLTVEGYCSVETSDSALGGALEVTCKSDDGFKKLFLGLSDNVTYMVDQLAPVDVSTQHYRVIFKPSTVVPSVDAR